MNTDNLIHQQIFDLVETLLTESRHIDWSESARAHFESAALSALDTFVYVARAEQNIPRGEDR